MRHVLSAAVLMSFLTLAAVSWGQPPIPPVPATAPTPLPPLPAVPMPRASPVVPAAGFAPVPAPAAPTRDTPLSRFEPLAAYPATTQFAVRSVLLGSGWLTRMNQSHGRFLFGYRPALRQPMDGDHDLKQAFAALALAQAAKFAGDDRQTAVAGQAILTLLAATKPDPSDPGVRVPVHSSLTCNRVGFAAVLALAIYELPGADAKLLAEAERLCGFLRKQLRTDGSVHYTDEPGDTPTKTDPAGVNEFPGYALHAIAVGNRAKPEAWKLEAVGRGLTHYRGWFKANPHPLLAATLTPAFTELHLQTRSADAAAAVFEMNDWLAGLQYAATDARHPLWAGGFRGWANGRAADTEPGIECGPVLQSLACAYQLTRLNADLNRAARYRQSAADAAQFLTGLQYVETNTRHFESAFRANMLVGGFHLSPTDGDLRADAAGWAVTGLLRYLTSGAEKE